jgi:two-component system response regulator DesR
MRDLLLGRPVVGGNAAEVPMAASDGRGTPLSPPERRALSLSASGLGVSDVAAVMHVPPAAVRTWLASAIRKLGARSKLEAVIRAARTGQIDLP